VEKTGSGKMNQPVGLFGILHLKILIHVVITIGLGKASFAPIVLVSVPIQQVLVELRASFSVNMASADLFHII
jgi:hypothetical protein